MMCWPPAFYALSRVTLRYPMGNDRLEVSLGDVASRLDSAGAQAYNAIPPREGCWIHTAPQSILLASHKSTNPLAGPL